MRNRFSQAAGLLGLGLIMGSAAGAGERVHEKHVVAVRADNGQTIKADVSELQPGEARTFVTADGTAIDVLRGAEGIEIYVDGERVEPPPAGERELAAVHREFEIECESIEPSECDEDMTFLLAGAAALEGDATAAGKRIEIVCDDDGGCDEQVWIDGDGEALDLDALPAGDRKLRIIRIHEEIEGEINGEN